MDWPRSAVNRTQPRPPAVALESAAAERESAAARDRLERVISMLGG